MKLADKYGKKESLCGGWTPCPSEPKLGNVTTGLQRDSLNRLENLTLFRCTWIAVFINSLILVSKLWHKRNSKICPKLIFANSIFKSLLEKECNLSVKISFFFLVLPYQIQAKRGKLEYSKRHNKIYIIYCQAGLMSFLERFFNANMTSFKR